MSKNLRVFLLTVLAVMIGVSSAFAAAPTTFYTITSADYDESTHTLSMDKNDVVYVFPSTSGDVSIDKLVVTGDAYNVILRLPAPIPDQPGLGGTKGKWELSLDLTNDNSKIRTVVIDKAGTNSAILPGQAFSWDIPTSYDFKLDAPIRVNNTDEKSFDFTLNVQGNAKMTFGTWAEIFTEPDTYLTPKGYVKSTGHYTVNPKGELVIQSPTALQGASLDVYVANNGTLTFDLSTTSTHNTNGATLCIDGNIQVLRDLTLTGMITASEDHTLTKIGGNKLTITQGISSDVIGVTVSGGTLAFTGGSPTWTLSSDTSSADVLTVASGAYFEAGTGSIRQTSTSTSFDIAVAGTATFAHHAIYYGTQEIYPYDDYKTYNNGLTIQTNKVHLDVASTGNAIINGAQAFSSINGTGTITVNGSEGKDDGVLILTSATESKDYVNFAGTITGTHANVGLYDDRTVANASFDYRLFKSADLVSIDNLIVYGPAMLQVSGDSDFSGVQNVYLRGHRPGADNTKASIANAKLTVGKLYFMPESRFSKTDDLNGIRIDGTSNGDEVGAIILGQSADVYVSGLEFYANLGTSRDFTSEYRTQGSAATGIYSLMINGSEQPSRLTVDGTETKGTGLAADLEADPRFYNVVITDSSDVKFYGTKTPYYPLGRNNSLVVGKDGKLEITRGAVIDGHLAFEGSTNPTPDWGTGRRPSNADYPRDSWFALASEDQPWNLASLDNYSTFTTQVGAINRDTSGTTAGDGEYAVKVAGDLTLSFDKAKADAGEPYPGNILVRVKPDIDAFSGVEFTTIGETFKVLGTTGTNSKYQPDFTTSYNEKFIFRIPSEGADIHGVTVGVRAELAILELQEWSFIRGGDTFGQGAGHDFAIKIPYKIWVRGENAFVSRDTSVLGISAYYLGLGSQKYYLDDPLIRFRRYEDGSDVADTDNVLDEDAWSTDTLVRTLPNGGRITLRAEFDYENEIIRLIGTSFSGEDPVIVSLALLLDEYSGGGGLAAFTNTWEWLDGVIPAYRSYTIVREGASSPVTGLEISTSAAEISKTDFVAGGTEDAVLTIANFRRAGDATAATVMPVNVNGTYQWVKVKADDGSYYILDQDGARAQVTGLTVVRFDGEYGKRGTTSEDLADGSYTIVFNADGSATVTVPAAQLGTTGTAFSATKQLAVKLARKNGTGELMTAPQSYTLHATVAEADTKDYGTADVTVGGDAIAKEFDVFVDFASSDIHFITYNISGNSWLGYSEYDGGFAYNTGDLTNVAPGLYTFSVLAYTGDNATTSPHKLYTFKVNVLPPAVDGIAAVDAEGKPLEDNTVTVYLPDGTATVTLNFTGEATGTFAVTPNDGAPESLVTLADNVLTVNAAGVAEGTYTYTITGGDYSYALTVKVVTPEFEIEEGLNEFTDSPIDGRTYKSQFHAVGTMGEAVTWTLNAANAQGTLYGAASGDWFVVEGIAKAAQDADENDEEQSFSVTAATAGGKTATFTTDTFTVEAEDEEIAAQFTTNGLVISGDATAVSGDFQVMLPAGVTAADDTVNYPSWITPIYDPEDDTVIIGFKYYGQAGNLDNGAEANIVAEAENEDGESLYYKLPVTYAGNPGTTPEPPAPKSFDLTLSTATVDMNLSTQGGNTAKVTLSTNSEGAVTYEATVTPTTGLTVEIANGVATLTATASGDYTVTFKATETATGKTVEKTAAVKVASGVNPGPGSEELTLTPSATTIEIDLATSTTGTVTLTPANASGAVNYSSTVSPATGLEVAVANGTATFTATAEGSYTVTFTATDAGGKTAKATVTVTVTDSTSDEPVTQTFSLNRRFASRSFDISLSPVTLSIDAVVTPVNNQGTVSYTATTSDEDLSVSIDNTSRSVTLTALEAGTYTVTLVGTDTAGKTASATFTIVVTETWVGSSGGGCDAGFGALALALAMPLFLRRRRS